MTTLEENILALEKRYPTIHWQKLFLNRVISDSLQFTCMTSKNGSPNFSINNHAVHSLYHPENEATKVAQDMNTDVDAYLLLGFGFCYMVKSLQYYFPQKKLILVEENLDTCHFILSNISLSSIILNENIEIFWGAPSPMLSYLLKNCHIYRVQIIKNRCLNNYYVNYVTEIENVVKTYMLRKEVNQHTLEKQGHLWIKNFCQNMPFLAEYPGIKHLYSHFQNIPMLLVAAGPSVNDLWQYLPDLEQRCLIICVDTSLRLFNAHHFNPDIIVSIDSQYWNSRHLDHCFSTNTLFIADPSLHPATLRKKNLGKFFLTSSLFPFGQYIENDVDIKGELTSGGSVATSAFALCQYMGANSIYCIGLDLGFPEGKTHAHGCLFEEWALADHHRLTTLPTMLIKQTHSAYPVWYKANKGEKKVLTDKRMEVYRLWFEEEAKNQPCYNLSSGVAIDHMPEASFEQLLSLPIQRDKINSLIEQAQRITIEPLQLRNKLLAKQKNILSELCRVKELCEEAKSMTLSLIEDMKLGKEISSHLTKLEKIDTELQNSKSKDVMSFWLELFLSQFNREQQSATTPLESVEKSLGFYEKLHDSINHYYNLLMKYHIT